MNFLLGCWFCLFLLLFLVFFLRFGKSEVYMFANYEIVVIVYLMIVTFLLGILIMNTHRRSK